MPAASDSSGAQTEGSNSISTAEPTDQQAKTANDNRQRGGEIYVGTAVIPQHEHYQPNESHIQLPITPTIINNIYVQIFLNTPTNLTTSTENGGDYLKKCQTNDTSNVVVTKPFDKQTSSFIKDNGTDANYNPDNIIEVKAVIVESKGSKGDILKDPDLGKELDEKLEGAIPVIVQKINLNLCNLTSMIMDRQHSYEARLTGKFEKPDSQGKQAVITEKVITPTTATTTAVPMTEMKKAESTAEVNFMLESESTSFTVSDQAKSTEFKEIETVSKVSATSSDIKKQNEVTSEELVQTVIEGFSKAQPELTTPATVYETEGRSVFPYTLGSTRIEPSTQTSNIETVSNMLTGEYQLEGETSTTFLGLTEPKSPTEHEVKVTEITVKPFASVEQFTPVILEQGTTTTPKPEESTVQEIERTEAAIHSTLEVLNEATTSGVAKTGTVEIHPASPGESSVFIKETTAKPLPSEAIEVEKTGTTVASQTPQRNAETETLFPLYTNRGPESPGVSGEATSSDINTKSTESASESTENLVVTSQEGSKEYSEEEEVKTTISQPLPTEQVLSESVKTGQTLAESNDQTTQPAGTEVNQGSEGIMRTVESFTAGIPKELTTNAEVKETEKNVGVTEQPLVESTILTSEEVFGSGEVPIASEPLLTATVTESLLVTNEIGVTAEPILTSLPETVISTPVVTVMQETVGKTGYAENGVASRGPEVSFESSTNVPVKEPLITTSLPNVLTEQKTVSEASVTVAENSDITEQTVSKESLAPETAITAEIPVSVNDAGELLTGTTVVDEKKVDVVGQEQVSGSTFAPLQSLAPSLNLSDTCPEPNDVSDAAKADVLFFLHTSTACENLQFAHAIQLIQDTISNFANIGSGGVQFSVAQFDKKPIIEIPLSKHDCKPFLLKNIAEIVQKVPKTELEKAVENVVAMGFTSELGDRKDVENVLVLISDGTEEDRVQQPLKLTQKNGATILVIAALDFHPILLKELISNNQANMFNMSDVFSIPLANRLAQRIREVAEKQTSITVIETSSVVETATNAGETVAAEGQGKSEAGSTIAVLENVDQTVVSGTLVSNVEATTSMASAVEGSAAATTLKTDVQIVTENEAKVLATEQQIGIVTMGAAETGETEQTVAPNAETMNAKEKTSVNKESFVSTNEQKSNVAVTAESTSEVEIKKTTIIPQTAYTIQEINQTEISTVKSDSSLSTVKNVISQRAETVMQTEEVTTIPTIEESITKLIEETVSKSSKKNEADSEVNTVNLDTNAAEIQVTTESGTEITVIGSEGKSSPSMVDSVATAFANDVTAITEKVREEGTVAFGSIEPSLVATTAQIIDTASVTGVTEGFAPTTVVPLADATSAKASTSGNEEAPGTTATKSIAFQEDNLTTGQVSFLNPEMETSTIDDLTVQCLENGFNITIKLQKSFGGSIFVKGQSNIEGCSKSIDPEDGVELNNERYVTFFVDAEHCNISKTRSEQPIGTNTSAVINVLHHKWLETGTDRGYFIQCFIGGKSDGHDISTELDVRGTVSMGGRLSLEIHPPYCKYSLRGDSPNGPVITIAEIGQVIYHRWDCESENGTDVYGMHVHDCFAGANGSHEFLTIDSKGCSPNHDLLDEVKYAEDSLVATAESKVFRVADIKHIIFRCKVSLCTKAKNGCLRITPPDCSRKDNETEVLQLRQPRDYEDVMSQAYTSNVYTDIGVSAEPTFADNFPESLKDTVEHLSHVPSFWLLLLLVAMAIFGTIMLIKYIRSTKAEKVKVAESESRYYDNQTLSRDSGSISIKPDLDGSLESQSIRTFQSVPTMDSVEQKNVERHVRTVGILNNVSPKKTVEIEFEKEPPQADDLISISTTSDSSLASRIAKVNGNHTVIIELMPNKL